MKKSELQKFQDFKRKYKFTDKQIANILADYANTEDEYSASFFAAKNHISEYLFYKMRDFCIIFMLVDASTCKKIRDKTFRNQSGKNVSGNYTAANRHYKNLIQKRNEYLNSFSVEEITLIAIEYSNGEALYDIAKKYNLSTYTVQKLLAIALRKHLVCDTLYLRIKYRSDRYIAGKKIYFGPSAEQLWNSHSKKD